MVDVINFVIDFEKFLIFFCQIQICDFFPVIVWSQFVLFELHFLGLVSVFGIVGACGEQVVVSGFAAQVGRGGEGGGGRVEALGLGRVVV
jgi:hypothetical protein